MATQNKTEIIISAVDRTKAAFAAASRSLDAMSDKVGGLTGKFGKLAGIGVAVSAGMAALENIQAIKILDQLDDLAEKTGISVEKLSELRFAGEATGTPLAALATGISKLGKNMAEAAGGNKEATATFQAMNVEIKNTDGTLRSTDEVLADVAARFATYSDGPEKAALAQRIFGKSGEELIPILNQGKTGLASLRIEAQQLGAIYSGDVAKAAADFNDNLTKIKLASEAAAVAISGPLIKALADLSGKYLEAKKNGELFSANMAEVVGRIAALATIPGQISFVAEWLTNKALPKASPAGGGRGFINPEFVTPRQLQQRAAPVVKTPGGGSKGAADDPTKKLLDNRLKELQRAAEQERELMSDRNDMLQLYNEQGLLSMEDYYSARQAILDEATEKQKAALDAQIAALKESQSKATKDTDRAEAEGKINELLDKRAKLERESGQQTLKLGFERQKAAKEYQDEVNELDAKLADMTGSLAQAAAIRFDKQFEPLRKVFSNEGNAEGEKKLKILRGLTLTAAQLNKASQSFGLIQGDLQIAEDRITIARERGTMGEIESLRASGQARQRALAQMREQLAVLEKIDEASRTPEQAQQIERLRLQAEQLAASLDPLADRLNTIISDAAGDALYNVFTGDMKPLAAAKQFFGAISKELGGMLMKDLASSLTKGEGGGLGGILSRALGGSADANGLFGGLFGRSGLKGPALGSSPVNAMYVRFADGIPGLGSAGAASGGSSGGIAGLIGNLFGGLGTSTAVPIANALPGNALDNLLGLTGGFGTIPSFDVGTDFVPQDMLAVIHRGERIETAAENQARMMGRGAGFSQVNNFTIEGQVDRRTQNQVANEVRRRSVTAAARLR